MNPTINDTNVTVPNGDTSEVEVDVTMVPSPLSNSPSNLSDPSRKILIPRKRNNPTDVKPSPPSPYKISRDNNLEGCNAVNRALNPR